jgi:hypothetical protein
MFIINPYIFTSSTPSVGDVLLLESGDHLLLENGYKLLLETSTPPVDLTYFQQFYFNRDSSAASLAGYTYRIVVPSGAFTCSGQGAKIVLYSGEEEGCVIAHASIGERDSGYDMTATPTEITFDTGSSGCTIAADGTKISDAITVDIDAAKSYVITLDITGAQTVDALAQFDSKTDFDTGYKAATASWDQATVSGFSSMTAGSLVGIRSVQVGADIDDETVLLIHGNGYDAATSVLDFSSGGKTVTVAGNAQVDIAQSVFGGGSVLLDGTGDYLSLADSDDWDFADGDFTLEARVRFASVGSTGMIFAQNGSGTHAFQLYYYPSNGRLYFDVSANGSAVTQYYESWAPSTNTWYHIAVVRHGEDLLFFIDGTQLGSTKSIDYTIYNSNATLYIGCESGSGNFLNGHLDEIRISKGIARWTEAFTLPTKEYGA